MTTGWLSYGPLRLWGRRGLASRAAWILVGLLVAVLMSRGVTIRDPDWALRSSADATLFFCPVLAAAVAYDVGRRVAPTLAYVARTGARGPLSGCLTVPAGIISGMAVYVVAWVGTAIAARWQDGMAVSDVWIVPETFAALSAAACVGMMIGSMRPDVLAPALAAGVLLLIQVLTRESELSLFAVAASAGTMVGIERTPLRAVSAIGVNVAVALGATIATWAFASAMATRRGAWLGVAAIPLALVLIVRAALLPSDSEYRPSTEPTVCVGVRPSVCGPVSARVFLVEAQADLSDALVDLAPSGLPFQQRYTIARGGAEKSLPADTSELLLDPSQMVDGHLTSGTITEVLSVPRYCPALTDAVAAQPLLQRIEIVHSWLARHVGSRNGVTPAPAGVVQAYEELLDCSA